jgi:hypothetical protein
MIAKVVFIIKGSLNYARFERRARDLTVPAGGV